mmetsp:Transcript_22759/g.25918  ORF Transcript_22759/g.25918 Transcript_22759/m.25918 type:complete len:379 (+) Transcript_22759:140-1276(+)
MNSNRISGASFFDSSSNSSSDNIMNMRQPCTLKQEAAIDELQVMLHQESTKYLNKFNYLSSATNMNGQDHCGLPSSHNNNDSNDRVGEGWRRKICEWAFEVVDHFGFDREVVSIALNFLDRVATLTIQEKNRSSSFSEVDKEASQQLHRREFQLIAVTCLYMAIKVHGETDSSDGPRKKLRIQAFVELSRGLFTIKTLAQKEFQILRMLEWNVNPPSTVCFLATLLRLLPAWMVQDKKSSHTDIANALYEMARYLSELAVCVSTFSFNYKSSEVGYACILCAFDAIKKKRTIFIPYEFEVQFMENVAFWSCNSLTPERIAPIQQLLMELCPGMFIINNEEDDVEDEEYESDDDSMASSKRRNGSPISVMTPISRYYDN